MIEQRVLPLVDRTLVSKLGGSVEGGDALSGEIGDLRAEVSVRMVERLRKLCSDPEGSAIGCFPIRDMGSIHLAEDLAPHFLLARRAIREHSLRSRDDLDSLA